MADPLDALRPYQHLAIQQAREVIRRGNSPVVVVPTGGGKTHIGAGIVHEAIRRGRRVLWLAHRMELIDQAAARLAGFGLPVGIIMAGRPEARDLPVQVASVQTLARRAMPEADLVVIDEAHHVAADTYRVLLERLPDAYRVGLTATPRRLDGKGLRPFFTEIVAPITIADLIAEGLLVKPRVYAPTTPDLKGIRKQAGDYAAGQLSALMSQRKIVGDVVRHYLRLAEGRKGVVFACGIEHSRLLVEGFLSAGVRAAHLDGNTSTEDRQRILASLRDGGLDLVSNVQVLTEGWDLPALEVCIVARPTASWALHVQMVGRVMRADRPDKQCILLDHAGNTIRHGFVTDAVEYSLEDDDPQAKKAAALPGLRTCKECLAVMPSGTTECPLCGVRNEPQVEVKQVEGFLEEVVEGRKATPQAKEAAYLEAVQQAEAAGYKLGWASIQYKQRFGVWPRGSWFARINREVRKVCRHKRRDGHICVFCFDGARTWEEYMRA